MEKNKLIKILRNYKNIVSKIDTHTNNLKLLKEELEIVNRGGRTIVPYQSIEEKLIIREYSLNNSPVERQAFKTIVYADIEALKIMINKEYSKINYMIEIIYLINNAIKSLFFEEIYIIKMSYTEKRTYRLNEILIEFNKFFKKDITFKTIKNKKTNAIKKLYNILKHSYILELYIVN